MQFVEVGVALRRMAQELHSDRAPEVMAEIMREVDAEGRPKTNPQPEKPVPR